MVHETKYRRFKVSGSLPWAILCASLFLATLAPPVAATTNTISISTGNVSVGPATISITYTLDVSVIHPASGQRGSTTDWQVSISNGKLTLTLSVLGHDYSTSVSEPLGRATDIPIANGISVTVSTTASSPVQVSGPASSNTNSLIWHSEGPQSFQVQISNSANEGSTITVSLPISVALNVGLAISLFVTKYQVANFPVGSFQASPTIVETMTVGSPPLTIDSTTLAVLAPVVVAVLVGYIFFRHRRKYIQNSDYVPR